METQKKYNQTKSDYDGWLAQLKFNIRQGVEVKSLKEKYKPIADEITDFVKYANSQTGKPTKFALVAILGVIGPIIDILTKLWKLYKDADKETKDAIIKEIDAQTWKDFKSI
jgi:hypothetical protein